MQTFYTFCAIFGGAFIVIQFLLSIIMGVGANTDSADGSFESDTGGDADLSGTDTDTDTDSADQSAHHGDTSISFLKMLSIRTVTAGMAFFGLGGLTASSAGLSQPISLAIAIGTGLVVFVLVYFLYRFISSFRYNGAISEHTLLGSRGMVHVRVPGQGTGSGKVIVNQQDRSMEYEAIQNGSETLKAGTPIVVKQVVSSSLVLVEAVNE